MALVAETVGHPLKHNAVIKQNKMSKSKIKIPRKDAFEKLDQQIKKGSALIEDASENFKKSMGRDRRVDDNFENKYKLWLDMTIETMDDIYLSREYVNEFRRKKSSQSEYVAYDWKPDIKYWVTKKIIPKIDYLVLLRESLNEFEVEQPANEVSKTPSENGETLADTPSDQISNKTIVDSSGKKIGRTFWDILVEYWKPILTITVLLLGIIILLASINIIRFGYNDGFYFEIGKSYNPDGILNGLEFTHSINTPDDVNGINFRTKALYGDEKNAAITNTEISNQTLITWLKNGTKVILISDVPEWHVVLAIVNNKLTKGYISSKYRKKDTLEKLLK